MRDIIKILMIFAWISGIVIAKGFWSTFFAIWLVPWSWYLVVERLLTIGGVL